MVALSINKDAEKQNSLGVVPSHSKCLSMLRGRKEKHLPDASLSRWRQGNRHASAWIQIPSGKWSMWWWRVMRVFYHSSPMDWGRNDWLPMHDSGRHLLKLNRLIDLFVGVQRWFFIAMAFEIGGQSEGFVSHAIDDASIVVYRRDITFTFSAFNINEQQHLEVTDCR